MKKYFCPVMHTFTANIFFSSRQSFKLSVQETCLMFGQFSRVSTKSAGCG